MISDISSVRLIEGSFLADTNEKLGAFSLFFLLVFPIMEVQM